ncbi:MAG: hypothetical protein K2N16_08780 [Muribaculaceae bacterium]|nr:hypothetical protein [Muribaculaceae bacterium]
MKRLNKSIAIPAALLVYNGVMAYIAWPEYRAGRLSALEYFGVIGIALAVVVALHFIIKKRDRLRREREQDIKNNFSQKK